MEAKLKHLEFIQSNIARMNQCSFQMKGWMVTIVSALLAVYAAGMTEGQKGNAAYLFVAIIPTVIFWLLDSYYLQQERKFRGVYNDVAEIAPEKSRIAIKPFEMPLGKYTGGKYCFCAVLFSRTEWPLYVPIIVCLFIAGMALR